jgi:hypothetical protein
MVKKPDHPNLKERRLLKGVLRDLSLTEKPDHKRIH